jgi:hypothetical protein
MEDMTMTDEMPRAARCVLISEGLGNRRDMNFYSKEAITSAVRAFEGKPLFVDHPSATEDRDRPERSVRDLAGYFSDCREGVVTDPETGRQRAACFATLNFDDSEAGHLAYQKVKAALDFQRRFPNSGQVYCGLSINATGLSEPAMMEGQRVSLVKQIQDAVSADIVTRPARGGKFLAVAGR